MDMSPREYQDYVKNLQKKSPLLKDMALAFAIGGAICVIGQLILNGWLMLLPQDDAATATSVSLVFLSALFTGLNLYNKLARFGGAGTLVPITGFANAVVSAATSGSSRPLWRLDGDRLYIVSDQLDTDRLEARLGKPIINTLDYRPFLDKLQNGETRRFTLTATPVVSKDGKRTPLRTPAGMHQWAEGKLTQAGARLDALDILDIHATRFNRQGRKLTFHTVEYTGEITITDRDKLTQTMLSGIGHGKAYGLGLMLLF